MFVCLHANILIDRKTYPFPDFGKAWQVCFAVSYLKYIKNIGPLLKVLFSISEIFLTFAAQQVPPQHCITILCIFELCHILGNWSMHACALCCFTDLCCMPGKADVAKFVKLHPEFAHRRWDVIKAKIFNQIQKNKRLLKWLHLLVELVGSRADQP